jgi:hypothetical protein
MQADGRPRLGRLLIDSRSVMVAEAARHGPSRPSPYWTASMAGKSK